MRIHASHIHKWRLCRRKARYSADVPRDQSHRTIYTVRGTLLHELAETYLQTGDLPRGVTESVTYLGCELSPDEYNTVCGVFTTGVPYLPEPGTLETERAWRRTHDGVVYGGTVDMVRLGADTVFIGDHKSASTPRYIHTPETLAQDPQWLLYAWWALQETPSATSAEGMWLYYIRSPRKAIPVRVTATRAEIEEAFARLHRRESLPILRDAQCDPTELPRTLSACNAYGGCEFRAECHIGMHWTEYLG